MAFYYNILPCHIAMAAIWQHCWSLCWFSARMSKPFKLDFFLYFPLICVTSSVGVLMGMQVCVCLHACVWCIKWDGFLFWVVLFWHEIDIKFQWLTYFKYFIMFNGWLMNIIRRNNTLIINWTQSTTILNLTNQNFHKSWLTSIMYT